MNNRFYNWLLSCTIMLLHVLIRDFNPKSVCLAYYIQIHHYSTHTKYNFLNLKKTNFASKYKIKYWSNWFEHNQSSFHEFDVKFDILLKG